MSTIDRTFEKFSRLLRFFIRSTDDPSWKIIYRKFDSDTAGRKVLADLFDDPDNDELRKRFLLLVRIYMEGDPDFFETIVDMVGSSQDAIYLNNVPPPPPPPPMQSPKTVVDEFQHQKDSLLKKIAIASEQGAEIQTRRSVTRAVKKSDLKKSGDNARGIPKMDGNVDFSIPSFEMTVKESATEAPKEDVAFTAMYSRDVQAEVWNTLLFNVHLTGALDAVKKDAERFKDQIPGAKDVTAPSSTPLVRGTELTITPICDGVTFNPPQATILWLEDLHRVEFRFRADKSLIDYAAKGSIEVRVGPLIAGAIKPGFTVNEDVPNASAPEPEQAEMYHQDYIFISYSHKDTGLVLQFKKAYEAIGDNVLIDIDTLRSGQEWNAELMKIIQRAEIFQLFWSENSSESKYCKQEWEHALSLNRPGFVRPCYWTKPTPAPPDELRHLHFEFVRI